MPDRPFVIWKGHGADQGIHSARCDQGTEFHDVRRMSWFASSRDLAAVVVPGGNGIRAAWRGAGGDERLWWTPDDFASRRPLGDGLTTSDTPAVIPLNFSDL